MEQVYHQAQGYYAGMLQDIQSAQSSIDLEAYIYSDDELGQQFNSALISAAQRGVRVRVMIDGAGSGIWANKQLQPLIDAGVEAHIFRPMPWRFWQWSMAAYQRPGLKKLLYLFNLMNHRNHRKVMIVDKHIVWLGSFNITQEHLPQNQGGEGWRDTGVRLDSVNADELLAAYDAAWNHPGMVKNKAR